MKALANWPWGRVFLLGVAFVLATKLMLLPGMMRVHPGEAALASLALDILVGSLGGLLAVAMVARWLAEPSQAHAEAIKMWHFRDNE